MRRWCALIVCLCFLLGISSTHAAPDQSLVTLAFNGLAQGRIGEVWVSGENISRVRAAFLDHQYLFLPAPDGAYRGLIAAPMDAPAGKYRLSVLVFYADDQQEYLAEEIAVTGGSFERRDLTLPADKLPLLNPELYDDELAILNDYINILSEGNFEEQAGLKLPIARPTGEGFGSFRTFNGTITQRHTGADFPSAIGTPVKAAAGGRVILQTYLPIRGNYLLIDHGSGVLSGYAHLAESFVEGGDVVQQGSIIGVVGNTGRAIGSHLHWEVALGGVWVDPLEAVRLLPPQ